MQRSMELDQKFSPPATPQAQLTPRLSSSLLHRHQVTDQRPVHYRRSLHHLLPSPTTTTPLQSPLSSSPVKPATILTSRTSPSQAPRHSLSTSTFSPRRQPRAQLPSPHLSPRHLSPSPPARRLFQSLPPPSLPSPHLFSSANSIPVAVSRVVVLRPSIRPLPPLPSPHRRHLQPISSTYAAIDSSHHRAHHVRSAHPPLSAK
ncbi:hypothetical protein M0R45_018238 [Rubus argutus]|uniref:Uncharacterized protein n=1 Tax=Rubus argutus TaxID=59490 RepID=A0AAW1X3Q0_RUBAR